MFNKKFGKRFTGAAAQIQQSPPFYIKTAVERTQDFRHIERATILFISPGKLIINFPQIVFHIPPAGISPAAQRIDKGIVKWFGYFLTALFFLFSVPLVAVYGLASASGCSI